MEDELFVVEEGRVLWLDGVRPVTVTNDLYVYDRDFVGFRKTPSATLVGMIVLDENTVFDGNMYLLGSEFAIEPVRRRVAYIEEVSPARHRSPARRRSRSRSPNRRGSPRRSRRNRSPPNWAQSARARSPRRGE